MFKTKVYGIFERRNMVTKGKVMKKLAAIFSLSLVSVCSFGAWPSDYFQFTDARVRPLVEAIDLYGDQSGVTNLGPTVNGFDASGDVSVTGDIEASGNVRAATIAVTGGATVNTLRATGRISETYASSIAVTNGQILLMTSRSADYSAAAQGSITVTNVLAGPGAGGVGVFVTVNNVGVSNAVLLSKTAALMGPAISMAPTSSVTLLGFDANTWIVTGKYP